MADDEATRIAETTLEELGWTARQLRRVQHNRYLPGEELGRGGMGVVELVVDRALDCLRARKRLLGEIAEHEAFAAMLAREARLTAGLAHPHVVPVHELGLDDRGRPYFTMQRIEGRTLRDLVDEHGPGSPLDWDRLLDQLEVVLRVCDALAFAHSRGVLHCDVKPNNVMIGEFGQVYLMDWGIARLLVDEAARSVPDEGERAGTPQYMAPEQAIGAPLDARVDVFAVGGLLYFLIAGRAPYAGPTSEALAAAAGGLWAPLTPRSGPPALIRIVHKAMASDRERRYRSIAELRDELVRFVRGGGSFRIERFAPGETIVREGDAGDVAYIIEGGRCEVTMGGSVVREMGPGEVFGEMSVLAPGPRTATVRAIEPTILRALDSDALLEELETMKPWMASLVRTLAARLRERG